MILKPSKNNLKTKRELESKPYSIITLSPSLGSSHDSTGKHPLLKYSSTKYG